MRNRRKERKTAAFSLGKGSHVEERGIGFPETYCVIDLEATTKYPNTAQIIAIGAIRAINGSVVDDFKTLIQPPLNSQNLYIDGKVEGLTGITNKMLQKAPTLEQELGHFADFIKDDVLIGWNIDRYDKILLDNAYEHCFGRSMPNGCLDAYSMATLLLKSLDSRTLQAVAEYYGIDTTNWHNAYADALMTHECYLRLKEEALVQYGTEENFLNAFRDSRSQRPSRERVHLSKLVVDSSKVDETNLFYQKHCIVTGNLARMTHDEFAQNIKSLGGICQRGVTKETNFLILADEKARAAQEGNKTAKLEKAECYQQGGRPLKIIDEQSFYEAIERYCF